MRWEREETRSNITEKKKNYICACCFELALVGLCWGIFSSMRQTWIHGISKAVFSFKCVFVVKNFKVILNNYTIAQSISMLSELFSAIFWPRIWIQYMSDGDIVLVNLQLWAFVRKKRVKWSHLLPGKKRKRLFHKNSSKDLRTFRSVDFLPRSPLEFSSLPGPASEWGQAD